MTLAAYLGTNGNWFLSHNNEQITETPVAFYDARGHERPALLVAEELRETARRVAESFDASDMRLELFVHGRVNAFTGKSAEQIVAIVIESSEVVRCETRR